MSENTENTNKTKSETVKIDGISAQINLSPGSETHIRFAKLMREAGAATARAFVETLMDVYENLATSNSETIAQLEQKVRDLQSELQSYDATVQNLEQDKADLQQKLEEANKIANENAVTGLGQMAQIEDLKKKLDGALIFKPNPVVDYFLRQMEERTGKGPAEILQSLFLDDLQNPTINNLPYIVTSAEIRRVMNELKSKKDAGKQE